MYMNRETGWENRLAGAIPVFVAVTFLALPIVLTIAQGGLHYVMLGFQLWPVFLSMGVGSLIFAGLLFWQFRSPAEPNRISFWTLTAFAFLLFGLGEAIWMIAVNGCC